MRGLWIAPACVAAAIVYAWFDRGSGIQTWFELRDNVRRAEAHVHSLRQEIARLEREIESFERSPFAVERAIREELDWVRPGEVLVRMPDADGLARPAP